MATSRNESISPVINAVMECDAKYGVNSVLDVGCGAGLYGSVLRQYLDYTHNRIKKPKWEVTIDGIEGCERFKTPNWKNYNNVEIADIGKKEFDQTYDVVLFLDVVEHFEAKEAHLLLEKLYAITNKYLIIASPTNFREQWEPEEKWNTDYQRHKSLITPDNLEEHFNRIQFIQLPKDLVWLGIVKQEHLMM